MRPTANRKLDINSQRYGAAGVGRLTFMDDDMPGFMFEGMPVGIFLESEWPRHGGRYRYMPYRGLGHYQMQTQRREKGNARCYYDVGSERVSFTVADCPEYGILVLVDFEVEAKGGA